MSTKPPPFPSPEEVKKSFEDSLFFLVEAFSKGISELFLKPPNSQGFYSIDVSILLSEFRPYPDFVYIKSAFDIVKSDLERSGWDAELRDSQRDGMSLSIRPKKKFLEGVSQSEYYSS